MDVCLCRIEKEGSVRKLNGKARLVFSGARRPLYILNGKGIEMIRGDRKTIGGRYKRNWNLQQGIPVSRGDRIYLTTDGISDQNSPEREKFGINRLMDILFSNAEQSMEKQKQSLEEELIGFMKYEKQRMI